MAAVITKYKIDVLVIEKLFDLLEFENPEIMSNSTAIYKQTHAQQMQNQKHGLKQSKPASILMRLVPVDGKFNFLLIFPG